MNKQEFVKAFNFAKSRLTLNKDLSIFDGFGLEGFKSVFVTIESVASLIRWQALQLNGQWSPEALNEVATFGRKRFIITGSEIDDILKK